MCLLCVCVQRAGKEGGMGERGYACVRVCVRTHARVHFFVAVSSVPKFSLLTVTPTYPPPRNMYTGRPNAARCALDRSDSVSIIRATRINFSFS